MGNWASTLAQQDAYRLRMTIITVSLAVGLGLLLAFGGLAYAYKSRKNRELELARARHEAELQDMEYNQMMMLGRMGNGCAGPPPLPAGYQEPGIPEAYIYVENSYPV